MNSSQKAWIFAQLKKGKKLTAVAAYEGCGAMRLAAVIYELREAGYPIASVTKYGDGKKWAEYSLAKGWK